MTTRPSLSCASKQSYCRLGSFLILPCLSLLEHLRSSFLTLEDLLLVFDLFKGFPWVVFEPLFVYPIPEVEALNVFLSDAAQLSESPVIIQFLYCPIPTFIAVVQFDSDYCVFVF